MMQHVCSGDMKNAEASEDSDCPRLERSRWSPGAGVIGSCHIQIAFLYAFKKSHSFAIKMRVLADYVLRLK
jgi:hypothetical protein